MPVCLTLPLSRPTQGWDLTACGMQTKCPPASRLPIPPLPDTRADRLQRTCRVSASPLLNPLSRLYQPSEAYTTTALARTWPSRFSAACVVARWATSIMFWVGICCVTRRKRLAVKMRGGRITEFKSGAWPNWRCISGPSIDFAGYYQRHKVVV